MFNESDSDPFFCRFLKYLQDSSALNCSSSDEVVLKSLSSEKLFLKLSLRFCSLIARFLGKRGLVGGVTRGLVGIVGDRASVSVRRLRLSNGDERAEREPPFSSCWISCSLDAQDEDERKYFKL